MTAYDSLVQTDGGLIWPFSETAGPTALAFSGGSHNATYDGTYTSCTLNQGVAASAPAGIADGVVQFNGTTSFVTAPSGALDQAFGDGPMTVEAWIKCSGVTSTVYGIISGTNSNTTGSYFLCTAPVEYVSAGVLRFGTANVADWQGSAAVVVDNAWHHVAVALNSTANGRNNTAGATGWTASYPTFYNMWVDGVTSVQAGSFWAANTLINGSGGITIGSNGFVTKGNLFPGYIAKPAVYPSMLTSAQVAAHYNAGLLVTDINIGAIN